MVCVDPGIPAVVMSGRAVLVVTAGLLTALGCVLVTGSGSVVARQLSGNAKTVGRLKHINGGKSIC